MGTVFATPWNSHGFIFTDNTPGAWTVSCCRCGLESSYAERHDVPRCVLKRVSLKSTTTQFPPAPWRVPAKAAPETA